MTGRQTGMTRPQRAFGTAISYWESATHEVSAWKLRELERALGQRIEP